MWSAAFFFILFQSRASRNRLIDNKPEQVLKLYTCSNIQLKDDGLTQKILVMREWSRSQSLGTEVYCIVLKTNYSMSVSVNSE